VANQKMLQDALFQLITVSLLEQHSVATTDAVDWLD
jgi:hypothetical protein